MEIEINEKEMVKGCLEKCNKSVSSTAVDEYNVRRDGVVTNPKLPLW